MKSSLKNFGFNRKSGILMPISALPSKYGIGDLGDTAYRFIDFMTECGVRSEVLAGASLKSHRLWRQSLSIARLLRGKPLFHLTESALRKGASYQGGDERSGISVGKSRLRQALYRAIRNAAHSLREILRKGA